VKVLVVDDGTVARMIVSRTLQELYPGCRVLQAADGQTAVALVEQDPSGIELALLDFNMPGMNGLELAEALSSLIPDTRKILCTANAQESLEHRAHEMGIEVLHKPITVKRLSDHIGDSEAAA
jgi:two-component system chemotaxis response regulator CheY